MDYAACREPMVDTFEDGTEMGQAVLLRYRIRLARSIGCVRRRCQRVDRDLEGRMNKDRLDFASAER